MCGSIMVMIVVALVFFGLALGSFINALVWRIHEQESASKSKKSKPINLSIVNGRSVCVNCKHELSAKDLVPVFSWLSLRGRCRYCHKPISGQYPAVELLTSLLFVLSYTFWPMGFDTQGTVNFAAWLVILTGLVALVVYDLRWMLLPNRIVYPLGAIAGLLALFNAVMAQDVQVLVNTALSVAIAGGIFYVLFQASNGKWIGGGDVKLGLVLGLILQDPFKAFLTLFFASVIGSLVAIPGMLMGKLSSKSRMPFGPFLITAAYLAYIFGDSIISWYKDLMML